jgi:hypothetical protein
LGAVLLGMCGVFADNVLPSFLVLVLIAYPPVLSLFNPREIVANPALL